MTVSPTLIYGHGWGSAIVRSITLRLSISSSLTVPTLPPKLTIPETPGILTNEKATPELNRQKIYPGNKTR
jgi:hypothetical protein